MRKSPARPVAAAKAPPDAGYRENAPVELVCLSLVLALFTLACRIATTW
jgi:hypothetical protein